MPKSLTAEEAIFAAAREKGTPEQRAAYLDEVCKHDGALRARIENLLKSDEQADSGFLEAPYPSDVGDNSPHAPTTVAPETAPAVNTPMLTPVQHVRSMRPGPTSPAGYQI